MCGDAKLRESRKPCTYADTEPMLIILKDIENRVGGHCHLITFPNKRSERNFSRPIAYDLVSIRQCVETIEREIE